jgi:hypothetical protein
VTARSKISKSIGPDIIERVWNDMDLDGKDDEDGVSLLRLADWEDTVVLLCPLTDLII